MINPVNEKDIVIELRGGSRFAYEALFRHFYASLCFFANRLVIDHFAAEDIVQETLFKFWQKRADFDSFSSIKAFLYISTRNACLNLIEKDQVRIKHWTVSAAEDSINADEINVLHAIMHAEVIREVSEAIESLPEQCRKIIKMTFEEGLKPKEIADHLGLAVSTVNNQKMRGLSLLRAKLANKVSSAALLIAIRIFFT